MSHTVQLRSRWARCAQACAAGFLCLGLVLVWMPCPLRAEGDLPAKARGDGFDAFCVQWMQKLAARERANLASAEFRKHGNGVVAEYTGYARQASSCESRVARPGAPGVGLLTYHEIRYRKRGADRDAARKNDPQVLERVEITEVFRYDGSAWAH